jgi:uncharacterized protein (DUF1330 family)
MKGYWLILGTEITDQVAQDEYNRLWAPIAEKYQARLNPTKLPPLLKEVRNTSRVIIAEFPSYEMAKACYADPAYQEARQFALRASKRDLLIFEGEIA